MEAEDVWKYLENGSRQTWKLPKMEEDWWKAHFPPRFWKIPAPGLAQEPSVGSLLMIADSKKLRAYLKEVQDAAWARGPVILPWSKPYWWTTESRTGGGISSRHPPRHCFFHDPPITGVQPPLLCLLSPISEDGTVFNSFIYFFRKLDDSRTKFSHRALNGSVIQTWDDVKNLKV